VLFDPQIFSRITIIVIGLDIVVAEIDAEFIVLP
jgi:hypothetical protein